MSNRFFWKSCVFLAIFIIFLLGIHSKAPAKSTADFYKGKVVRFIVPFGPGGGYDTYCRLIAKTMEKYMNCTVIVINRPGAGGLVGMNYLYVSAPKDGLTLALGPGGLPLTQLIGAQGVKFDCRKFNWLASVYRDLRLLGVDHKSPYKTLQAFVKVKGLKAAESSVTSPPHKDLILALETLGLDSVKIVSGYLSSPQVLLALKRGEADFTVISLPHFLRDKTILHPLAVIGDKRIPQFPDLPAIFAEFKVREETKKAVETIKIAKASGRSLAMPPGVPIERVNYLRKIMMTCLKDQELLKKAKRVKLTVAPLPGEKVKQYVDQTFNISPEETKRLKYLLMEKYQ